MSDFNAKMHQIRFPSICIAFADPLAVFKGPTFKGKEGKGRERKRRERGEGNRRVREANVGEGCQNTTTQIFKLKNAHTVVD